MPSSTCYATGINLRGFTNLIVLILSIKVNLSFPPLAKPDRLYCAFEQLSQLPIDKYCVYDKTSLLETECRNPEDWAAGALDAATGKTVARRARKEEPLAYIVKLQVRRASLGG